MTPEEHIAANLVPIRRHEWESEEHYLDRVKRAAEPILAYGDERAREAVVRDEEEDTLADSLSMMQAKILTGVANALKGDPPPLVLHDWSDLPEVANRLRAQLDELLAVLLNLLHCGCTYCRLRANEAADKACRLRAKGEPS